MSSLCQSQQRCVKASIVSSWRLAEAQDQLCSLGVHSSESLEQERARVMACPADLTNTEEEWRRKESMLGVQEPSRSSLLETAGSWDVFDKVTDLLFSVENLQANMFAVTLCTVRWHCIALQSIINVQNHPVEPDQDKCKTSLQKYEPEIRHFGKWQTKPEVYLHFMN